MRARFREAGARERQTERELGTRERENRKLDTALTLRTLCFPGGAAAKEKAAAIDAVFPILSLLYPSVCVWRRLVSGERMTHRLSVICAAPRYASSRQQRTAHTLSVTAAADPSPRIPFHHLISAVLCASRFKGWPDYWSDST